MRCGIPSALMPGSVRISTRFTPNPDMSKPISSVDPAPNFSGGAPQVKIVSSMTGRVADAQWGSAEYWLAQLASPVRYAEAIRTAVASGIGS